MMQAIKVCRQGYQYVPSHRVNPSRHQLWCTTTPESVFSRALCSTGVCHQPERGITTPLVSIPQPTNFSHEVACEARIPVTGELIGQVCHRSQPISKCNHSSVTRLCFRKSCDEVHNTDAAHLLEGLGEGCSKPAGF
ncbi:TPA: hypothetical protein ACH3X3_005099 [Trebouxia sp. C0006]